MTTMSARYDAAMERLLGAAEDDSDLESEAAELFAAIYGRAPDDDDGDAGALISLCYAALHAREA